MKLISEDLSHNQWGVILYRDDLEYILAEFRNANLSIAIKRSGMEFASLDELLDAAGRQLATLEIVGTIESGLGSLSVHLDIFNARISTFSVNIQTELAYWRIRELILKRRRWAGTLLAATSFLGVAGILVVGESIKHLPWFLWVLCFFVVTGFASCIWSTTRIRLYRRHEHGSFWKRNADNLVKGALLIVIGMILTQAWQFVQSRVFSASTEVTREQEKTP